jgi:hypothetical protein
VRFVAITLWIASQRVFIVVYFVIDSVRKLLDIPSYDFRPLEHWDCGFESRSRHGCMSAFFCVVLFCVGSGLAMD